MQEEKNALYLAFYFNTLFTDPFKMVEKEGVRSKTVKDVSNIVFPGDTILRVVDADFSDPGVVEKQDYVGVQSGNYVTYEESSGSYISQIYGYAVFKGRKVVVDPLFDVARSKLLAYMYYLPNRKGRYPTLDDIRTTVSVIDYKGYIGDPRIAEQIDKIFGQQKKFGVITVCKGLPPKDGQVEHFVLKKDYGKKAGTVLEDGRIDFKEQNIFTPVVKGEAILERKPHVATTDGYDIYGEVLKGQMLGEKRFIPGKNLEESKEEANVFIAVSNGVLSIKNKRVSVETKTVIKKDIDYETGNINAEGTIEIFGSVKSGFDVVATDDVIIHGNVEDSRIIAGNNIYIENGILGKEHAYLEAGNNIVIRFAQNTKFKAGNDMHVKESLIQCKVYTKNVVLVDGTVVGGEIIGKKGVSVKIAGSEKGVETKLGAGKDPEIEDLIRLKEQEKKDSETKYNDVIEEMKMQFGNQFLLDLKGYIGILKGPRKVKFLEKLSEVGKAKKSIQVFKDEIEALKQQISFAKLPVIDIKERVYADVVLQIRRAVTRIKKERLGTIFREDKETGVIVE